MEGSNQLRNTKINRVYTTVSGFAVMSILVLGKGVITTSNNFDEPRQNIYYDGDKTSIYKSFTDSFCMIHTIPGYSDTKSIDLGVEKIMINEEKAENLRKINSIAALGDDWNGNGAKAFDFELIERVRQIITCLDIQPELFPTACESIQLEYDKTDGSYMEIEIGKSKFVEVFVVDCTGKEIFSSVSANVDSLNKVVNEFYG